MEMAGAFYTLPTLTLTLTLTLPHEMKEMAGMPKQDLTLTA